jgi:hypothetical protein
MELLLDDGTLRRPRLSKSDKIKEMLAMSSSDKRQ